MKYLYLLLLSVMFIPISQVAYGQNIIDQIGQAFNNLTSGVMGGNQTNQTSTNNTGSSNNNNSNNSGATGGNSSVGAQNQSSQDIGSIQDLQNLTSGNQKLLTNNTSIAPENASLPQGLEKEQYVEPENQSNALSAPPENNSSQTNNSSK